MKAMGLRTWVVPGGWMPLKSTGREPEFTSHDRISVLNTSSDTARLEITIFSSSREPVGPYDVSVRGRRCRQVRFNDLIDPEAIALETACAAVIRSDVPVVVQFTRVNSGRKGIALMGSMAYGGDSQAAN